MRTLHTKVELFSLASLILFLAGMPHGVANSAPAQTPRNEKCGIFLVGESKWRSLDAMIKKNKDIAAKACVDSDGVVISYSSVSPVWARPFGVCAFQVDTPRLPKQSLHSVFPRQTFMAVKGSSCPKQNSSKYIPTAGISEGLFVAIDKLVSSLRVSREKFEIAFAMQNDETQKRKSDLKHLRNLLQARDPLERLQLRGIRLTEPFVNGDTFGYELLLRNMHDHDTRWFLIVDLTPEGLKIFNFSQQRIFDAN